MLCRRVPGILGAILVAGLTIFCAMSHALAQGADDVKTLNTQVGQLATQGKYEEATSVAERALALAERTLGETDALMLTSIDNLAELMKGRGRYNEAERLFKRALAIKEPTLGKDDDDTLDSVLGLATVFKAQGRYNEAEPLFLHAAEARQRVFGADHDATLRALNGLALLYLSQGRFDDAERIALRVSETAERKSGKNNRAALEYQGNLASIYRDQGRYKDAEPLLLSVVRAQEATLGKEHASTLVSTNNLAELYTVEGRDEEAEQLYKRVLEIKERTLGSDHPSTLIGVNNLAELYDRLGRYKEAEPLYQRALAAKQRTLGPENPLTIAGMRNLGSVYRAEKHNAEAQTLFEQALVASERVLGAEHPSTLICVNNLASLYQDLGRRAEAEALFKRAIDAYERTLGPDHPLTLIALNNIAYLYKDDESRDGETEQLLNRVVAARERTLGADHPDTLASVNNIAAYYFGRGNWKRAAPYWRRSTNALIRLRLRDEGGNGKALTTKHRNHTEKNSWQFRNLIRVTQRLSADRPIDAATTRETFETAQWVLGSEAAQSLADMAARGAKGNAQLAAIVRERQDLAAEWQRRDALRNAEFGASPEKRNGEAHAENLAHLTVLDERIAAIDKRLAAEFSDYAALVNPAPLTVEEVQTLLQADEALVLFLDTPQWRPAPNESFIWVVTKTQARRVRSDLGTEELIREVKALRCGLDESEWAHKASGARCRGLLGAAKTWPLPFDLSRAHALYQALFGQIEDLIKNKHLLLVPSGPLTQLPFQVLVTSPPLPGDYKAAGWLARSHALTVLPAVSSLKALRSIVRPSRAAKPMIGFGNPLLDGADSGSAELAQRARDATRCADGGSRQVAELASARGVTPLVTSAGLVNTAQIRMQEPLPETADELCAVARDPLSARLRD